MDVWAGGAEGLRGPPPGAAARGGRRGDCVQRAAGKEPRLDRRTVEKRPQQRKNKVHKEDGGLSVHTAQIRPVVMQLSSSNRPSLRLGVVVRRQAATMTSLVNQEVSGLAVKPDYTG